MTDQNASVVEVGRQHSKSNSPSVVGDNGSHHIVAAASVADERIRVLKHADTFAIFDHYGNIKSGGLGEEGLYHDGTRYLSRLVLEFEGSSPFFLSSTIRDANDQLTVALTNPDMLRDGRVWAPLGTLYIRLKKFLWHGVLHQRIRVRNLGLEAVDANLTWHFLADYADIYEIRGMKRRARGIDLEPQVNADQVVLAYRGLDEVQRSTVVHFSPRPARLSASMAHIHLSLDSQQEITMYVTVGCVRGTSNVPMHCFNNARSDAESERERYAAWSCHLNSSNEQVNTWIGRAQSDLHMMTTQLPTGPYPYAGVPWFNTPFGRDGIVTALECLWLRPELARGVLAYLAARQATEIIPNQDAEPGKILHETRSGEMAALKEMPFGFYFGSVDSTPLFVVLAAEYFRRTADRDFIQSIWPNLIAAQHWIDRYGDRDGDGFVEYHRQTVAGLLHQGWRDSDDAVFHADGTMAEGPIALCEVQGYVYAAWRAAATLAELLGQKDRAASCTASAERLARRFNDAFWCDDLSAYAVALDGSKQPCKVRASTAGQCLFTGIVRPNRAGRLARALLSPEWFSGWGIRTVPEAEARYNPMAYHNGAVWPHDSALIALGLARYGRTDLALQIFNGMFEAGQHFDLNRMPELFCGFARQPEEGPVPYPVACAPQAWSAASVFLLIQACLGLEINAPESAIHFNRPRLPAVLNELRIHNLDVAGATIDLLLDRHKEGIGINVLRREGNVQITVEQ